MQMKEYTEKIRNGIISGVSLNIAMYKTIPMIPLTIIHDVYSINANSVINSMITPRMFVALSRKAYFAPNKGRIFHIAISATT